MSAIRNVLMATLALTMTSTAFAQDVSVLRIGLDGSENEADQIGLQEFVRPMSREAVARPAEAPGQHCDGDGVVAEMALPFHKSSSISTVIVPV